MMLVGGLINREEVLELTPFTVEDIRAMGFTTELEGFDGMLDLQRRFHEHWEAGWLKDEPRVRRAEALALLKKFALWRATDKFDGDLSKDEVLRPVLRAVVEYFKEDFK